MFKKNNKKEGRELEKDRSKEKKREENVMKKSSSRGREVKKRGNEKHMEEKAELMSSNGRATFYEVSPVTYVDVTCPSVITKNYTRFLGFIGFNYAAGSSYGRENVDGEMGGTVSMN